MHSQQKQTIQNKIRVPRVNYWKYLIFLHRHELTRIPYHTKASRERAHPRPRNYGFHMDTDNSWSTSVLQSVWFGELNNYNRDFLNVAVIITAVNSRTGKFPRGPLKFLNDVGGLRPPLTGSIHQPSTAVEPKHHQSRRENQSFV